MFLGAVLEKFSVFSESPHCKKKKKDMINKFWQHTVWLFIALTFFLNVEMT